MKYNIEDFNICSSAADYELRFNPKFREAVTFAINYQMEEYETANDYIPNLDELTLYFFPESDDCRIEIKNSRLAPSFFLADSVKMWLEAIEQDFQVFGYNIPHL